MMFTRFLIKMLFGAASPRWRQWIVIVGLLAIVSVTFHGVLGHQFLHYDDLMNICNNPHVNGLSAENVKWMLTDTTYAPRYMPLGWLCYALDRQLFGLNPRIWHAGNLLMHLLNTVLLFLLLKRLVWLALDRQRPEKRETIAIWCGALGALVWSVNPLRVEVVAWASSRIYEVAFLFMILSLLAWLRARSAVNRREEIVFSWLSLAAFAASLFTYPLALFAPALLLALDVFPFRKAPERLSGWFKRESWPLWRDKIPFAVTSLTVLLVTVAARKAADDRFDTATLAQFGIFQRIVQAGYVVAYYVWKPWVPFDLSAAYPTLHAFNPFDPALIANLVLAVGVTAATLLLYRRWPALFALWICHVIILLPVLGASEYPHCAYDRYTYLPAVLWSAALALGLAAVWFSRLQKSFLFLTAGASAVFACLSWAQVPVWHDSISLYSNIVGRFGEHPSRGRFDEVLGVYYLRAGRTNEAVASLKSAVLYDARRTDKNIYDERVVPRCERRLADISANLGNWPDAAAHYKTALKAEFDKASRVSLSLSFAIACARTSREAEALPWLDQAVELAPENAAVHKELGNIHEKLGHAAEARGHFEAAQRLGLAATAPSKRS